MKWRRALPEHDDAIVEMCLTFYAEDPGLIEVKADGIRRTLDAFRREPMRGRTLVVLDDDAAASVNVNVIAYALLIPYWSNEFGGLLCEVDELYVRPAFRNRGLGSQLFEAIAAGGNKDVWDDEAAVAIALIVMDGNARARGFYERIGFQKSGTTLVKSLR